MSTPHATYESDGSIATLTFNRPDARNAMTWDMYQALVDACDRADDDAAIRVLILKGAGGKAFVAGTDISQFTNFRTAEDGINYEQRIDQVLDRLERVTKATIAQIQGVAAGGGCGIALTCDLRIATPESSGSAATSYMFNSSASAPAWAIPVAIRSHDCRVTPFSDPITGTDTASFSRRT